MHNIEAFFTALYRLYQFLNLFQGELDSLGDDGAVDTSLDQVFCGLYFFKFLPPLFPALFPAPLSALFRALNLLNYVPFAILYHTVLPY
jgi:hypothetical protein